MVRLRFVLPAAVVVLAILTGPSASRGNVNYSKQEKRPCVTCHVSVKSKDLNAVGKCYKEKHKLDGCESK